jgi:hypothetical protein
MKQELSTLDRLARAHGLKRREHRLLCFRYPESDEDLASRLIEHIRMERAHGRKRYHQSITI